MSTDVLFFVLLAATNYFIGSIPFSYIIARSRNVDLRSVGSGNIGATNVVRSLGKGYGVLALLLDMLKGVMGALLVVYTSAPIYLSAFSVFGHNWSIFLGFKSGKGVATTLGLLLVLHWPTFLITLGVWALIALISRYVSLSSVGALMSVPITLFIWGGLNELALLMLALSLLSLFQHRDNFRKLFEGTENQLR